MGASLRVLTVRKEIATCLIKERDIKKKIFRENPVPNTITGTPSIGTYIKELLIENKKTLTLNHEDGLKSIHGKLGHVFGPL